MLADFAGISIAFFLFSCLTLFPGYTLGWTLNVLRFRQRELWFRLAIGVSLSIAVGPVMSYLIARWMSITAACWFYAALSAAAVPLIACTCHRVRKTPIAWGIAAWCVLVLLALSDLQIRQRLYFSVMAFDYALRTAFVSSISTFGLPAQNPFFYPGHAVPLRYHYFWLLQAALVHHAAPLPIDARQALIGGTMWCGIGLSATVSLYLQFFRVRTAQLNRQTFFAIGLMAVTGLNIVPALLCRFVGVTFPFHRDDQVDGWLYSVLWEPHYVAALIACLFGFLLISQAGGDKSQRIVSGGIAGCWHLQPVRVQPYTLRLSSLYSC